MKLNMHNDTQNIEFEVIYSKRKTLSIRIEPTGKVIVTAPLMVKEAVILDVVNKKSDWIIKKLTEVKEKEDMRSSHNYIAGENFLYLGRSYKLGTYIDKSIKSSSVTIEGDEIHLILKESSPEKIKNSLEAWYREKALEVITQRVLYYQPHFALKPNKITVKEQKKRWGSCSSKRDIFFNWKLIMAPQNIIDYVVVHEMSHLQHLDHSKNFWGLVELILPSYKEAKAWLKNYGTTLNL